jgi:hypothetical protein
MDPRQATQFYHKIYKNAKGEPYAYKRNGATKAWKTRPDEFSIPVKRGLREFGYVTHENIHCFTWS